MPNQPIISGLSIQFNIYDADENDYIHFTCEWSWRSLIHNGGSRWLAKGSRWASFLWLDTRKMLKKWLLLFVVIDLLLLALMVVVKLF
jgi:hypothetical protein